MHEIQKGKKWSIFIILTNTAIILNINEYLYKRLKFYLHRNVNYTSFRPPRSKFVAVPNQPIRERNKNDELKTEACQIDPAPFRPGVTSAWRYFSLAPLNFIIIIFSLYKRLGGDLYPFICAHHIYDIRGPRRKKMCSSM